MCVLGLFGVAAKEGFFSRSSYDGLSMGRDWRHLFGGKLCYVSYCDVLTFA